MEAMDLMDPKRRLGHNVRLMIGYVLVGIALLLLTIILLFVAYGFGLQNGRVIQNGLLFVSSEPNPAQVYVDGSRYQNDTNTKLLLNEGVYQIVLKRDGYRDWERPITVTGGQVESYIYPLLFPTNLTTATLQSYATVPSFISESNDQHWLLVGGTAAGSFDLYDLTNPSQKPQTITLAKGLLTTAHGADRMVAMGWASDNNHLLLEHEYSSGTEYILFNRLSPDQSQNLTKMLQLPTAALTLHLDGSQQDHYLVLDAHSQVLSRISLGSPTLMPILDHVVTFAANDDDGSIVYATPDIADKKLTDIMVYDGSKSYLIRHDAAGDHYLLATARFSGDDYVAISASEENTGHVYKDPIQQINDPRFGVAVPVQTFTIKHPTYVDFSVTGQYAIFENGAHFATYDTDNAQGFNYTVADKIDAPMTHANWMDGARLYYVSGGQVIVFDYDGRNRQSLVPADPRLPLAFDSNYKFLYAFVPSPDKKHELLTSTSLRTPADQ